MADARPAPPPPLPGRSPHRLEPHARFAIGEHDTGDTAPAATEEEGQERLAELHGRLAALADRLGADGSHALLVVLQGFDGAGKDGVISNVLDAVDPSMLHVFDFNKPVGSEAEHDFLWRFHHQTPPRGIVHVFDRSYYEEVISARVHGVVDAETCERRHASINDFEAILAREGTLVVKVFLHVSPDRQADRVRERLDHRSEQHRFSAADVTDRALWDDYDAAYEQAIRATGTAYAPWHVVPADHRWASQVAVAELLVSVLEDVDPQYPPLDRDEVEAAGLDPDEVLARAEAQAGGPS